MASNTFKKLEEKDWKQIEQPVNDHDKKVIKMLEQLGKNIEN